LGGGSEGSAPRNPQPTPRKVPPNSLYRDNEWIPGTGLPAIEKKGVNAEKSAGLVLFVVLIRENRQGYP